MPTGCLPACYSGNQTVCIAWAEISHLLAFGALTDIFCSVLQYTGLSRNSQAQKTGSLLRYFPTPRASHCANDNIGQKSNTGISPKPAPSAAACMKCMGDFQGLQQKNTSFSTN